MEPFVKNGDEQKQAFEMDFIGIQHYTREVVMHSYLSPFLQAKIVKANERLQATTLMNWEIYPQGMYQILRTFWNYGKIRELIITENGAAFPDQVENGSVNDLQRTEYLQRYLSYVLKAKNEGINVNGYFVWSFTDNFEWAEGYRPRFGLVYVDFLTQKRMVKASGRWYSHFLRHS